MNIFSISSPYFPLLVTLRANFLPCFRRACVRVPRAEEFGYTGGKQDRSRELRVQHATSFSLFPSDGARRNSVPGMRFKLPFISHVHTDVYLSVLSTGMWELAGTPNKATVAWL